jgi:predicted lactoylglutathione lyase
MPTMIFVNLPVKDLERSKKFFTDLGYSINPQFSDENGASVVISDTIYAMLLTEPYFKTFVKKDIADTRSTTEAIIALSAESKQQVDQLVDKALASGGKPSMDTNDMGFMYERTFQDPDGHLWSVFWMDPAAVQS